MRTWIKVRRGSRWQCESTVFSFGSASLISSDALPLSALHRERRREGREGRERREWRGSLHQMSGTNGICPPSPPPLSVRPAPARKNHRYKMGSFDLPKGVKVK